MRMTDIEVPGMEILRRSLTGVEGSVLEAMECGRWNPGPPHGIDPQPGRTCGSRAGEPLPPHGIDTAGLMTDLSGVGLATLRIGAKGDVPSVLVLDAPVDGGVADGSPGRE